MSKAYAINYDLKAPGRDYSGLYEAIKKLGGWWHHLESTWIVLTQKTSSQVWDALGPFVDKNDFMLIIEVRDDVNGWLPKDAWEWIHANVPK